MRIVSFALAAGMLLGAGCAQSVELRSSDGRPMAATPPAPFRIAVAPIVLTGVDTRGSNATAGRRKVVEAGVDGAGVADADHEDPALHFVYESEPLRQRIIAQLASGRAATEVFPVGDLDLLEARDRKADLLLRVEGRRQDLTFEGPAGGSAWLSGFLWLTTWAGSLWVPDSEYATGLVLQGTLVNPHAGRTVQSFTITTGPVRLNFWQRNSALSWPLLQSLVLPPFWTTDDIARTSTRISDCLLTQVSEELGRLFKEHLAHQQLEGLATIAIASPVNASASPGATRLQATITAARRIDQALVFLNGRPVAMERAAPQAALAGSSGSAGAGRLSLDQVLPLQPGRNEVQVQVTSAGQVTSRTVVVHNHELASFEDLTPEPTSSDLPNSDPENTAPRSRKERP